MLRVREHNHQQRLHVQLTRTTPLFLKCYVGLLTQNVPGPCNSPTEPREPLVLWAYVNISPRLLPFSFTKHGRCYEPADDRSQTLTSRKDVLPGPRPNDSISRRRRHRWSYICGWLRLLWCVSLKMFL